MASYAQYAAGKNMWKLTNFFHDGFYLTVVSLKEVF